MYPAFFQNEKGNERILIGDSDALIALLNSSDPKNQEANDCLDELVKEHIKVYFPTTTVVEVLNSLMKQPTDFELIKNLFVQINNANIFLLPVDIQIVTLSEKYVKDIILEGKTFSHAIICTLIEDYNIQGIFSFDEWYQSKGFRLVGDLLRNTSSSNLND